jgi:dTDP-4-amino-4,6-dideoxygalactose transaminase
MMDMNIPSQKTQLSDLAILGGTPSFAEPLHVGKPNVGATAKLMERFADILERRWFTNNGPYVQEFEQKIAEMIGVKHCIAMCNATVALEIAIRALDLKGEVIIPSFTFVATAHALQWQEITPVFCDVKPETHSIDPARIEALITPRTTGIMGVHVWGSACDIDALAEIAQRRHLRLLYDAAHAFGCSYQGQMIGNFGEAEVFSFHATKFLNSFEGGAVVTNNDELAKKLRYMRNFGFAGYDNVEYIGINGKMSEVSAAMGLTSLESIDGFIDVNRRNYECYRATLSTLLGVSVFTYDDSERCNYQYIIVEFDEAVTGISRDALVKLLHAENILARRYFYPGCHQMEPYRSYFPHAGLLLPVTESLTKRVMSLPNGTSITPRDIDQICHILRFALSNAESLREHLG